MSASRPQPAPAGGARAPRPGVRKRGRSTSASSSGARSRSWFGALAFGVVLGAAACDGTPAAIDASSGPSGRASAVSVRLDVQADKPASLTLLAFKAALAGVAPSEVLGLVDPLSATYPTRDCELRDADRAADALVSRGSSIELEELTGVAVGLETGGVTSDLRSSPRIFPDVAAAIGGVVTQAGPVSLARVPERLRVSLGPPIAPDAQTAVALSVPAAGWVTALNGTPPRTGVPLATSADLRIDATGAGLGGAETTIEIRPFGGTVALVCALPADTATTTTLLVPRPLLAALLAASRVTPGASTAAALDLVRRVDERLPSSDSHVTVEVRTSTLVELRP